MQQRTPAGLFSGWPFVGVAALAIVAAVLAAIATAPEVGEAAARSVRLTARTSVTLFLAAFTAAALWRFWPNAWTRWQRQNRRYLGVSFAFSHAVHLGAILWLQHVRPVEFAQQVNAITWIGGGLAYVFIAAMTGGTAQAESINRDLATVAEALGIGLCFGSQRPLLVRGLRDGYFVRDVAPTAPIFGNIGVVQARETPTRSASTTPPPR